jgi:hypothetical protein
LFAGPPGTGKSLLSRTLAFELNAHFVVMDRSNIIDCHWGDTEKALKNFMESAVKLAHAPDLLTGKIPGVCVVVIEEFDSLAAKVQENNSSTQFLVGINSEVKTIFETDAYPELIICASVNRLGILDPPIKRRFPTPIICVLPDALTRCGILLKILEKNNVILDSKLDLEKWCEETYLHSSSDIDQMAKEIVRNAKSIKRKWIYDQFNELYFPINDVEINCDYEGSAKDLDFANKKYKNLIITSLQTTKTTTMNEKEFIAYMEDAVEFDPSVKELFVKAQEKYTTKNVKTDPLKSTENSFDEDPLKSSENSFKEVSAEIWKLLLESINGSDDNKLNNEKFTKIIMEMTKKQMDAYKTKINNDSKFLDNWKIIIHYNNSNELVYFPIEINKKKTINDLKNIICDHEEFIKIHEELKDRYELINPESSMLLYDNLIIEDILRHDAIVLCVKK